MNRTGFFTNIPIAVSTMHSKPNSISMNKLNCKEKKIDEKRGRERERQGKKIYVCVLHKLKDK